MVIELPPVEANLLGFVDRANQQSNADGEEFDFGEGHFDVTSHNQTFVEHSIQYLDKTGRATVTLTAKWCRHKLVFYGTSRPP
jgi:hypothetical protein